MRKLKPFDQRLVLGFMVVPGSADALRHLCHVTVVRVFQDDSDGGQSCSSSALRSLYPAVGLEHVEARPWGKTSLRRSSGVGHMAEVIGTASDGDPQPCSIERLRTGTGRPRIVCQW